MNQAVPLRGAAIFSALAFSLALAGCGGDDDAAATSTPPAPPPSAVATTLSGAVVKGPVSGAQVCAFAVAGSARGAALGSCTTTDAGGNYSFAVPVGSGPLWIEATGGSYTDEVSGARVNLPAGSPLVSLATANGAAVTTMITPLTTLAFNAARSTSGASGTLDATSYAAAAAQLLSTFNLPSTLNISTTLPAFGSGINSYGTALTVISQMVANGSTLASILAATAPSTLAAAYAAAAAPPGVGGGGGGGGGTGGTPSASGTLTVTGNSAAGAASSLVPQSDGFSVGIEFGDTKYRFFRTTAVPSTKVEVTVTVPRTGAITVSYFDQVPRTFAFCTANCGVTITPASGATHPVTVAFANTALGGGITLSGSLVGDAPGAAWSLSDFPGGTSSSLTLGGAAVQVLTSEDSVVDAGGGTLARVISLVLSDRSTMGLSQTGSAAFTVSRAQLPATFAQCTTACNITVASTTGSTRVTFANTPLGGNLVLNGTVDYARTTGSLSTSDSGSFTPLNSNISSLNASRKLTFSVLGSAAQTGLSLLTVEVIGGRVIQAQATMGIGTQVLSCFDNGSSIGIPACTGVTVGADGRTVTFANAVLRGGAVGVAARNVTFNGTVVVKGP